MGASVIVYLLDYTLTPLTETTNYWDTLPRVLRYLLQVEHAKPLGKGIEEPEYPRLLSSSKPLSS